MYKCDNCGKISKILGEHIRHKCTLQQPIRLIIEYESINNSKSLIKSIKDNLDKKVESTDMGVKWIKKVSIEQARC